MKDPADTLTADLLPDLQPPRPRGRPAKHADAAARQRAYRERLKARGMREITRVVRDVRPGQAPRSEIIDLSECKGSRGLP